MRGEGGGNGDDEGCKRNDDFKSGGHAGERASEKERRVYVIKWVFIAKGRKDREGGGDGTNEKLSHLFRRDKGRRFSGK